MTAATSIFRDVRVLAVSPTVDDTPNYTAGDNMGGLMTFTTVFGMDGGGGRLDNILIADTSGANGFQIDVWFFDANPTGSTFTDNDAQNVAAADFTKVIDIVAVTEWDRQNEIARARNIGSSFVLSGHDSLYVAMEARGAFNLAAITDIDFQVTLLMEKGLF